jgi:hypothetical protein
MGINFTTLSLRKSEACLNKVRFMVKYQREGICRVFLIRFLPRETMLKRTKSIFISFLFLVSAVSILFFNSPQYCKPLVADTSNSAQVNAILFSWDGLDRRVLKGDRFFAFFHFSDPDHAGHKYGESTGEYREAAIECDKWLGEIVSWLKTNNLYDQTTIYVTADHGFDKGKKSHSNAPDIWIATNDPGVNHGGYLADIPATILARFGFNTDELEPDLHGEPLH